MIRLVRPNLGNPLILEPNELKAFEITIAYKKDWVEGKEEPEANVPNLSKKAIKQILEDETPEVGFGNSWSKLKIINVQTPQKYALFKDNYSDMKHPTTNEQLQYASGYRWEAKAQVGLTDNAIVQLKGSSWPRLLNLRWKFTKYAPAPYQVTNYHAIYVHETLKKSADFTILHITDTHIAKRNDFIPEILCRVRNKKECKDLKDRYINFNDHLRAFIKEGNTRVKNGEKVIVVLTGDIVDYYFDGYWDGGWVCGQGGQWKDKRGDLVKEKIITSTWDSNLWKFHLIITGSDGKSDELLAPIFVIPGNHEYYANEILMTCRIGASLLGFELKGKTLKEYDAFNLKENEGKEYDLWAYPRRGGKAPSIAYRKTFKEIQETPENELSPPSAPPSETWVLKHWQPDFTANVGDKSYWLIKPKPILFSQYLSQINYDVDFEVKIGNSHLLFFNTGHDRYPTKEEATAQKDFVRDFFNNGPHSRGVTPRHLRMLEAALAEEGEKTILIFTHAPLLCLDKAPIDGIEHIYEENLKKGYTEQLEALGWLSRSIGLPPEDLKKSGFVDPGKPQFSGGNFKDGGRGSFCNFYSMEGCNEKGEITEDEQYKFAPQNVREFMWLISRNRGQSTNKPILVFSGHTHRVHEFRIERQDESHKNYYHYCDAYSNKYFERTENSIKLLFRYGWLMVNSPLLLNTSAVRNKEPRYREIIARGTTFASLEMKPITRIEQTGNFDPGCKLVALRAHNGQYVCAEDAGRKELIANRNKIGPWETFEMIELDDGQVALKACNKKFVRAKDGGGGELKPDRSWIKDHESFLLEIRGENKIALRTHNGKYVCAEGGGGRELVANRDQAKEWETFEIIQIDI
ncbi:MAG: metallophosphoesterase [Nitrospira sp.]|nr:metallophosphoesterase [Nitrospira sp.]